MHSSDGKELPLFSPINLLIAAVAIVILAIVLLVFGNRIFNPGDLSASADYDTSVSAYTSHADFENECQLCHQPLRGRQADLCQQCHQNISNPETQGGALHGKIANVTECRACHPDHRGADFAQLEFARASFDHSQMAFPLDARHAGVTCQDCHVTEASLAQTGCADCHADPEVHLGLFSSDCAQCHQGDTWQTVSWQGQPFDHELVGFSLNLHQTNFSGEPIACKDCHLTSTDHSSAPTYDCQGCHVRIDTVFLVWHAQSFGITCTECHDGVDRMASFDHGTIFQLAGRHASLICADCHNGQPFNEAQTICATCHAEPEIHAGFFGQRCQMCHQDTAWQPARLSLHDFPLDHGGQGEQTCATCHAEAYDEYTCYSCHDHVAAELQTAHESAGITPEEFVDCTACHLDGAVHAQP